MIIECFGSLAPVLAAVKIDGTDGNSRIQIEIPASEKEAVLEIAQLQNVLFKLTIEVKNELTETAIPYTKEDGTFKATDIKLID